MLLRSIGICTEILSLLNFSHGSFPDYWAKVYKHGSIRQMIMEAETNDEEPKTSTPIIDDDYFEE